MEKFRILQGYATRQKSIACGLFEEIKRLDLSVYENKYVFALKVQQLYTAYEDFLKSVASSFENSIEDHSRYHLELLKIMSAEVPDIRPSLISEKSLVLLNKLRGFRHFIRHDYDYILDEDELVLIQKKLNEKFSFIIEDMDRFSLFLKEMDS